MRGEIMDTGERLSYAVATLLAILSLLAYYSLIVQYEREQDLKDRLAESQAETTLQRQRANAYRMRNLALVAAWQTVREERAATAQRRYVITSRWWRRQQHRTLHGWRIGRGRG